MSKTVNIHEAKTQLSRLVDQVAGGAEIVIAKAGRPVARLVPFAAKPTPKKLGALRGVIRVPRNFDAPLPDDVIAGFEGR